MCKVLCQLVGIASVLVFQTCCQLSSMSEVRAEELKKNKLAGSQPNIVLLYADDLGHGDLACYGHPRIRTDNIDRLMGEGLRLTNFYTAAPSCSPARASLLTGRTCNRTGMFDYIHPKTNTHVALPTSEITLAELLKEVGYQTALVGKWHLGKIGEQGLPTPDDHGFEHYFATSGQAWPTHKDPEGFFRNGKAVGKTEGYACQIVADEASRWLKNDCNKNKPFFLWAAFHEPHEVIASPPELIERYRKVARNENEANYFANVHNLDLAVGRVLKTLDELDLSKNTVVIFTSDHGARPPSRGYAARSYGRNTPFRGWKKTLFEGGLRVPAIVRWPGRIQAGKQDHSLCGQIDLLATFANLAGSKLPADRSMDSEDFSSLFASESFVRKTPLHWHFTFPHIYERGKDGRLPRAAIRDGDWMLLGYWEQPVPSISGKFIKDKIHHVAREIPLAEFELYHLKDDIAQSNDVAQEHPEVVERLSTQLLQLDEEVRREAATKVWWPISANKPEENSRAPRAGKTKPVKNQESRERPNVLLIVSEDNGAELGCYGTPDVRTPFLDQLATDGCRFANAYVPHAVCSASRAAFLTGLYPFQNGQIGLATHRYAMFQNWDNIPSILKENGYRTGMIGKLHVNPESAFPFDYRAITSSGFGKRPMEKYVAAAADFIKASDKPFFLAVNYPDAHFPLLRQQFGLPEKPLSGKDISAPLPFLGADSSRLRQGTADYYNCLMRLDSGIGLLLNELEESGKADNTLVIYIGDHGAQFSRGKATCYEGGLRIPMIVRWPGRVKPETVRDELVSTVDILPTVIQAASLPARAALPGKSVLPLAAGDEAPWREYLFAERAAYHSGSFYPQRTLRDERYKIILNLTAVQPNPVAETYRKQNGVFFIYGTNQAEIDSAPEQVQQAYATWRNPPDVELYDLKEDPWEFRNLADSPDLAKVKQRLLKELQRFREKHNDPLLDPKKLEKLAAEHTHVAKNVKGGRYGRGQNWKYQSYLRTGGDDQTTTADYPTDLSFVTVFARGQDGYPDYRIPALVTTRSGTLLAFAEGRQTLNDHARNDIVVKRSIDSGRTWGPLIRVHQEKESVLVNPCAVVLDTGRVLMMYQRFPNGYHARPIGKRVKLLDPGIEGDTVCTTLVAWSDDDGKTWSRPRDVTSGTKRAEKINSTATGPGRGIVLTRGKHKGRILMPTNEGWFEGRKRFFNVYACYSDDGGETWQFGKPAPNGEQGFGNEVQMVELSDGSVMLNSRSNRGTGHRKVAVSNDGGESWSPLMDEHAHPESGCMGTILRYSFGQDHQNRMLFANPNAKRGRKNGTVRLSYDDGKTWPVEKVVYPESYAYSCLTKLNDGSIGLLFESDGYKQIRFAHFDLNWLTGDSSQKDLVNGRRGK